MTPLELVDRAQLQPAVAVDRFVRVQGREPAALLRSGRPMLVSELLEHPDQHSEKRRFRYGHVLGPALSSSAIAEWQARHPHTVLAADVVALLLQVDGIHLWADLATGRAYFGILPLADWCSVREHEAAAVFEDLADDTLVISYHENGDYYLLLHAAEDRFTWFDPQSPDDSTLIDGPVDEFLEWWWQCTQELDPRTETPS